MRKLILLVFLSAFSFCCIAQETVQEEMVTDSLSFWNSQLADVKKDSERINIYKQIVDYYEKENSALKDEVENYKSNADLLFLTDSMAIFSNNIPVEDLHPGLRGFAKAVENIKAFAVELTNMDDVLATATDVMKENRKINMDYNGFLNTAPVQSQLNILTDLVAKVDEIDKEMFSVQQQEYISNLFKHYNKIIIENFQ